MGKVYAQLSIEERAVIQTQLSLGVRPSVIAANLNRSPSTISRELTRNSWTRPKACPLRGRPRMAGGYRADAAQKRAWTCAVKPRVQRRLTPGSTLWRQVMGYLKAGSIFQSINESEQAGSVSQLSVSVHE